jgi:hypothetical protein
LLPQQDFIAEFAQVLNRFFSGSYEGDPVVVVLPFRQLVYEHRIFEIDRGIKLIEVCTL